LLFFIVIFYFFITTIIIIIAIIIIVIRLLYVRDTGSSRESSEAVTISPNSRYISLGNKEMYSMKTFRIVVAIVLTRWYTATMNTGTTSKYPTILK